MGTTLSHIALAFPKKKFTNEDFFAQFPEERESKTWNKLGIKQRYLFDENEVPSDLAIEAAEKLFANQPELRKEIDFILFSCPERDYYTPVTSGVLQSRLEISQQCGCMDVHQGCTAFVYLLSLADGLVSIGASKKVLVLAVSPLSKKLHPTDKANRFLFGDAATAFVVEKNESSKVHSYLFGNDGSQSDRIIIKDGEARNVFNASSEKAKINRFKETQYDGFFYQNGAGVFRFTLDRVPQMIDDILSKANYTKDDIDLFILHQPNVFMVKTLAKFAKLPTEKVIIDVEDYGNTGNVSIPILLHNLKEKKTLKKGMKLLIAAFGTGLSWNGCIWEI